MSAHFVHALAVAVPMFVVIAVLCHERFTMARTRRNLTSSLGSRHRPTDASLRALAVLWVAAAAIHCAVLTEHPAGNAVVGVFFGLIAALQLGYAVLLLRAPSRPLIAVGLGVNLAVIGLWCYTRLVDVPFGLGGRQSVGISDGLAFLAETLGSFLSVGLILWADPLRRITITRWLVVTAVAAAVSAGFVAAATAG